MSKRLLTSTLFIFSITFGFSCRSSTIVKKLVNQNANIANNSQTKKFDGVMYQLPKILVQATVPVNKVTKTPGDFQEFAPCFFSKEESEKRVKAESKAFSISAPSFSMRGVADTSETYVIRTKGKYFESKSLFVEYAPNSYILQKGESESKDETLEFTAKAISTAASIASKAVIAASSIADKDPESEANKKLLTEFGQEHNCYTKMISDGTDVSAEKTIVNDDMKRILGYAGYVPLTTDQRLDRLQKPNPVRGKYRTAVVLFSELEKLYGYRTSLIANGVPNSSPETVKMAIEKNDEAIKAHRAAFLGSKSKETWAATFEFEPKKDVNESYSELLFSYTTEAGICNTGQLKARIMQIGDGFAFSNDAKDSCDSTSETKIQGVWLKVEKGDDQNYLDNVKNANDNAVEEDNSRGWFYRIPAKAIASLQTQEFACQALPGAGKNSCLINSFAINDSTIRAGICANKICYGFNGIVAVVPPVSITDIKFAQDEVTVAQLGVVVSVPASTSGRGSVMAISLDPTTGAMRNFKVSSSALIDKALLDEAQKTANSVIDASDPLNKKKRELEVIKTQNQINEEKKKLANTNTGNPDN